ncbi:MAG: GNAT family N-acetyltransferase [Conexivisphaerales archaeon]|jgi:ribosomal protein S18 acetylase RimI-like enzyme
MLIRRATVADANAIAHIQVDTWRTSYRGMIPDGHLDSLSYESCADRWTQRMQSADGRSGFLVAQEEYGVIIGFASYGPERSADPVYRGELYAIYVLEAHQKRGVGSFLVREVAGNLMEGGFDSMLLWVLADNPSRRFYEKLGGRNLRSQPIEIGGAKLQEVAYGWEDLTALERLLQGRPGSQG